MPKIFVFLRAAIFLQKTPSNFKAIAGLLGDLAGCMRGQIGMYFNEPWVREMLEHLKSTGDNEGKELATWAWDQIRAAVSEGQPPVMHNAM